MNPQLKNPQVVLPGLPATAALRKRVPLVTGLLDYFPAACVEVAQVSLAANEQHNPGEPMHWDRDKSTDHADCLMRHLIERGTRDTDGLRHTAKIAWRALALLQEEIETEEGFNPATGEIEFEADPAEYQYHPDDPRPLLQDPFA